MRPDTPPTEKHECPNCGEDVTAQVERKAKAWTGRPPKVPTNLEIVAICNRGHYSQHPTVYVP